MLLNLPPDRRGRINENGESSLKEFRRILVATFANDLVQGATVTASNVRGGGKRFLPTNVIDNRRDTYWATDDSVHTPELVTDLKREVSFSVVRLREYLPLGQRVEAFAVDAWRDDQDRVRHWHQHQQLRPLAKGTGYNLEGSPAHHAGACMSGNL
jgi:alpha-L-fucosidase